ncbi:uncharacterized protein LOC103313112 [Tribolium castaneum]|uniref:C-type lectin domain-containing protein n=1 Tax=Tribolium castaneum TaxID=7070 RepID=D6WLC4_TRICA|nr:PREDICTED: uncharacterized protein LOC103313112 [Tribolium castaneum]EFA04672.1 hypothetical protein TcasGA2_TC014328 [Tribolium castaneum]|eukprot:XP_008193737.1 PREDICTED: uncharacterized protein LOC103313112 [Tribolium castaneum]
MESRGNVLFVFALLMLTTLVSARAVNISNTWMLPEEGFPVFYRYFRDRISWYEADAVCQFHHSNLVTADSTSQYDAIRAYLKELDINENVWIGLSKTTGRPNFTWTNFRPLSGEGHWQQQLPKSDDSLCTAMDPVADFLWKPMNCGGPEIASFICELPVPSWAMGPKGCLLTELPSLTVLYIPEQSALELTSDCGLDGTKRIACKGNADREDILKQLSCSISPEDFEDKPTKNPILPNITSSSVSETSEDVVSSKTTKPWTSNTIDIDYGMPTRHRRETEDTLSPVSTKSTTDLSNQEAHKQEIITMSSQSLETETTSSNPDGDVTLDASVSLKSDKSTELKTTQVTDLTTQDINAQTVTAEPKTANPESGDVGEYPAAINQGQLFSIIENGTMFDILEVNDTSEDVKFAKEIVMETPQLETGTSLKYNSENSENFYTTVVYHKEPPSEASFVTNKSVKKPDKHSKKDMLKEKDPKKANHDNKYLPKNLNTLEDTTENEKTLLKEVEMFPLLTDPLTKLNRTYRKDIPVKADKHHHVEVAWGEKENTKKLFITTKRTEALQTSTPSAKENLELLNSSEEEVMHKIDSKIDLLNNNSAINNESETVTLPKPEKAIEDSDLMKKQFLPKSLFGETKPGTETATSEPLEPEPQAQPRPNRQRQLTRPQRRSFYPYFFSRVLG